MAEESVATLERQVLQLTREVADHTRQGEHEQKMRGFLGRAVQICRSLVVGKCSIELPWSSEVQSSGMF